MKWYDNPKIMFPMGLSSIAAIWLIELLKAQNSGVMEVLVPALAIPVMLFVFWLFWRAVLSIHHGVEYLDNNSWPFEARVLAVLRRRRLKRMGGMPVPASDATQTQSIDPPDR